MRMLNVCRPGRAVCLALAAIAAIGPIRMSSAGGGSVGDGPGTANSVVRIEEDWELIVNEPNESVEAPQFHTVMSPYGNLGGYYAQVIWNYREIPDYTSGGLQLQSWNGDMRIRQKSVGDSQLSTASETISWTQVLETSGTILSFAIINGQSSTWGEFGRDMRIDEDAAVESLIGYNPDVSRQSSWITYGSNRVNLLRIKQVRRYGPNGLVSTDNTSRVVFELHSGE